MGVLGPAPEEPPRRDGDAPPRREGPPRRAGPPRRIGEFSRKLTSSFLGRSGEPRPSPPGADGGIEEEGDCNMLIGTTTGLRPTFFDRIERKRVLRRYPAWISAPLRNLRRLSCCLAVLAGYPRSVDRFHRAYPCALSLRRSRLYSLGCWVARPSLSSVLRS